MRKAKPAKMFIVQGDTRHVLIRFSNIEAPSGDAISEHARILRTKGQVILGKFGRRITATIAMLNSQIKAEKSSCLFLVRRDGQQYAVYAAKVSKASHQISAEDRDFVPLYYRKSPYVSTWFTISELCEVENVALDRLLVSSSGFPVASTLRKSMAGFFFVRNRQELALTVLE